MVKKNSSYFLSLEKQKQKSKVISQLQIGNETTQEHKVIMNELHKFYSNLYKDTPIVENETPNTFFENDTPKLTAIDQITCEGMITEKECVDALKQMSNNKTPGLDGFPAEFYKFFWSDLKHIILDSYNYAYNKGELSLDQKRGIITLIPKKNKDRLFIKNWRPIALLSVDYKILAKILANRLKKVIHKIINTDQTGYIKGRYIGENIRLIKDVITYLNVKDKAGILCLIDFEKAFDTVKWNFIKKALKAFNFGPSFIKWVDILYKNPETAVLNNGYQTPYFKPQKGVRQGCPLSAYLFIIAVELLAIKIRNSPNIKGILIDNTEVKISQMADDTTVFLNDIDSIKYLFDLMEMFQTSSGLKANLEKTKFYNISPNRISDDETSNINFEKTPIQLLGLTITNDKKIDIEENFNPRLRGIENILKHWSRRKLSLKGKITIINSLAMSQIVYPATNLDVPSDFLEKLHKIFYNFLWDGKRSKIAAKTIENTISTGGLKMPNIFLKVKSWQLSWLRRALSYPDSKWLITLNKIINSIDFRHLAQCRTNLNSTDFAMPEFYKNIMQTWYDIRDNNNEAFIDIPNESLWYNKNITIDKKEIFWKSWHSKGIMFIHNLIERNGHFMSHTDISRKYGVKCSFLELLQIRMAIPIKWREKLSSLSNDIDHHPTEPKLYEPSQNKFKSLTEYTSKELYMLLNDQKKSKHIPTCQAKWKEVYPLENLNWKAIYTNAFRTCRNTKLQSLQYKIINRIIACNHWLFNLKVKDSPNCDTCKVDDNLHHFFINCSDVIPFWHSFGKWWQRICTATLSIQDIDIIFGIQNETTTGKCLNFLLIQAKKFIYDNKLNESKIISFYSFLQIVKNELTLEKAICVKNGKGCDFDNIFGFVFDNL